MRRRALFQVLLVSIALSALSCGKEGGSAEGGGSGKALKVAVIPKGTTHEFWKAVHAGALKAEKETGVSVVWKGPIKEDDLNAQIDVVQSFIAQGVAGIVLAPLNDKALLNPVKTAKEAKIPTVVFDSDLQGKEHVSFVATDNFAAGKLAGETMAKLLGDKGKVVMLRYQEGSASTQNRENGFLEAVKAHPGLELVSANQYAGATTETAFSAGQNILTAQKAADGGVDGVFCPNESTTFGMLRALESAGLAGKMKFIGFDSSEKLVAALKDKKIHGLVVQDPFNIGYLAVKTMAAHLKGTKVEARIDTGAKLVTGENMNEPAMKELLSPDLKTWLKE